MSAGAATYFHGLEGLVLMGAVAVVGALIVGWLIVRALRRGK